MPIPRTRDELIEQIESSFANLQAELELAVRIWWTENVADWIEAGRRGETPVTPAQGYRWRDTPRLNNDIVKRARRESFRSLRARLVGGYERVMALIQTLDDNELLEVGSFEWAGKYPVARWLSINTARQYTTACSFVRKARSERV